MLPGPLVSLDTLNEHHAKGGTRYGYNIQFREPIILLQTGRGGHPLRDMPGSDYLQLYPHNSPFFVVRLACTQYSLVIFSSTGSDVVIFGGG